MDPLLAVGLALDGTALLGAVWTGVWMFRHRSTKGETNVTNALHSVGLALITLLFSQLGSLALTIWRTWR